MTKTGNTYRNLEEIEGAPEALAAVAALPDEGLVRLVQGLEREKISELIGSCMMRILLETSSEEIAREVIEGFYPSGLQGGRRRPRRRGAAVMKATRRRPAKRDDGLARLLDGLDDVGRVTVVLRLKRPEKLMLALLARLERDEGLEHAAAFLRDAADKFERAAAAMPRSRRWS
jgi:hypothetical protein